MSLHLRLYSHHSPSPYPPLLPLDQHPPCPLFQLKTTWLGLQPSIIMVVRRRNPRLARGSAESVCLRAHRYLRHAPPRPHTRPRTLTTPLHATTLCSHLLPAHTPAPRSHLYLAITCLSRACRWASPQCTLRTARPSTSTQPTVLTPINTQPPHALAKYTKEPWLYPPLSLTKECSFVGRA